MLKALFEYITDSYSLLENPLDDYIVMAIVGVIAYLIAYGIVGGFYRNDVIESRGAGKILHWTIRAIVFVAIYYLAATMIRIYYWIICIPVFVWYILAGVSLLSVVVYLVVRFIKDRRAI